MPAIGLLILIGSYKVPMNVIFILTTRSYHHTSFRVIDLISFRGSWAAGCGRTEWCSRFVFIGNLLSPESL